MQQIRIDFDNPGLPQSLGAVEGESQSRIFQAALYKSGAAYTAPAGAVYSIMYRGFGPQNQGWYDTIEDGAGKRAACTVSGNVVTCELARQALRVPGHLTVVLCVSDAKGKMLKSWPIMADVRNDGYEDTVEVESFFYITQITSAEWDKAFAAWKDFKATIDPTLTLSGKAADAKATGAAVDKEKERASKSESALEDKKANKTDLDVERKRIDVLNEGGLNLKDEVIDASIKTWLADHPEATTTVQDHSLTLNKMVIGALGYVTPEMFGAKGDGVTEDTLAIQQALDSGLNVVFKHDVTYIVNDRLFLYEKNGISIIGNNSTLKVGGESRYKQLSNVDNTLLKIYECNNINLIGLNINGAREFIPRTDDTDGEYAENTRKYLEYRGLGFSGFGLEKSKNTTIYDCNVENTCLGIVLKNCNNCTVKLCSVDYTSADAFDLWYGCKNVSVYDCACSYNGDDAFAVYSLLKYWVEPNYSTEEVDVEQCENILFSNCYSFENRARFFINEGGNNVTLMNCTGINCQWIASVLTNENLHSTDNTIIKGCRIIPLQHNGITNNSAADIENANSVKISDSVIMDSENSKRVITVGGNINLSFLNCTIRNLNFLKDDSKKTVESLIINNCNLYKGSYFEFTGYNNIDIIDSSFSNNGDTSYALYVDNTKNIVLKSVDLKGKNITGSATNIKTNDITILDVVFAKSATTLKIEGQSSFSNLVDIKGANNQSLQFVNGVPYYCYNGKWESPFETKNAIGNSYDCNDLVGATDRQVTYCVNGAANMPINEIGLIVVNTFSNLINQTFYGSSEIYNRFYNGSTWGSWIKISN